MKKNLIKGLLLIVLSVVLVGTNSVFAADTSGIDELLDVTDIPTTTSTDTPSTTTSTPSTSTEKKEEVTTGHSSVYNNTTTPTPTQTTTTEKKDDKSLSKAGLEDSLPMVALIAVFGISAIVAFKKIKEYKNV